MPYRQDAIGSLICHASQLHSSIGMQKCTASLLDENTPCFGQFNSPTLSTSEQMKSMLCFELCDLPAERRLGYMQFVRGPSEVQFLG
jgi:hypothetical protein